MTNWFFRCFALAMLCTCGLPFVGCGGKVAEQQGESDETSTPSKTDASGTKTYALSDLKVGLEEYLPPLDDGRIEMAPPEGWLAPGRQKNYVVWFSTSKNAKELPQIRVTAQDAPSGAPDNVTASNLDELISWLENDLKETKLLEAPVGVVLGENAFGRYVRPAKYDNAPAERQILVTIHNGRLYEIELIVPADALMEYRDAAYATSAGLKYLAPGQGDLIPPGVTAPMQ